MKTQRRKFLEQLVAASFTGLALPSFARESFPVWAGDGDETYWEGIKKQFAPADKLVMMNAANLCPSPTVVNDRVVEFVKAMSRDVSFQYRAKFVVHRKRSIELLSQFVGAGADEIGITRNTSESNCNIVHGLDLKAGDEVIVWDQNHPSNRESWMNQAKRTGFTVVKVSVPAQPQSAKDLIEPFAKAITPNTRLISFSHISNLSGIALPATEICQMAKSKGIMTLVDGAQSLGAVNVNLHAMGCTFYTASTHKWLMGPFENGVIYVDKDYFNKIWPNIIGAGWKESTTVDENLCVLGQRNEPSPAALPETLTFHQTIGADRIQKRVVQLNTYLKKRIQEAIPKAEFVTPLAPELSAGIVIVNLPGKEFHEVSDKLYHSFGVAAAPTNGVRLSPHIYNTMKDIDFVVKSLATIAGT
ncbi:MAG TPA: aminotransferase class V-fold PLP-dependent enzyme [Cyclobacteriaceae bacterium]|jgi:selenocysteine lyase/cysteine desulfurase|nr:aminotransferase class V-fold PLP-dependent enzyme [Cyclobacteriaceae bacterium]